MAFFTIIKDTFIQFYEHLFRLVLLSLAWFVLSLFPIMSISSTNILWLRIFLLVFSLVISGPVFLSGLNIVNRLLSREEPEIKDFFVGIKRYFKKGIMGLLFTGVIYLILFFDIRFFTSRSESWLMLAITMFMIYVATFFSMTMIHFWGLLAKLKDEKFWRVFKYSFVITTQNMLVTALLLLFIVIFSVIMLIFVIAVPAVYFGIIALLILNGTGYAWKKIKGE